MGRLVPQDGEIVTLAERFVALESAMGIAGKYVLSFDVSSVS